MRPDARRVHAALLRHIRAARRHQRGEARAGDTEQGRALRRALLQQGALEADRYLHVLSLFNCQHLFVEMSIKVNKGN